MKKNNNKGFSLVELIVVIAIMAVLVGVLAPSLLRYVEKARIQKDASAVSEVAEAIVIASAIEDVYKSITDEDLVEISTTGVVTAQKADGTAKAATDALQVELTNTIPSFTFSGKDAATVTIKLTKGDNGVTTEVTSPASSASDWAKAVVSAGKH